MNERTASDASAASRWEVFGWLPRGRGGILKRLAQANPLWAIPAVALAIQVAGPKLWVLLRYDRGAIAAGQWWRIVTGNFVHAGWVHLGLDFSGYFLLWYLFGRTLGARRWWWATLFGSLGVGAGLYLLSPTVRWYVGISGVLHTYWGAGALLAVERREFLGRWLLAFLILNVVFEAVWGPLPTSAALLRTPILTVAHLYGTVVGLLLGAVWIVIDRRRARSALRVR
jgi:rhomboid family GlyGly-CTERM serine protease